MVADSGGGGGGSAVADVFTPPPGSPTGIHAAAGTMEKQAGVIGDLASAVKRRGDGTTTTAQWTGPTQQAFAGTVTATSAVGSQLEAPTNRLGAVVRTYADALDTAQKAINAAAGRYTTAAGHANDTADTVNANPDRTQADIDRANATIHGFATDMTNAQDDATKAWAVFRTARDLACTEASECATTLEKGGEGSGFAGALEKLKGASERFHGFWDLGPNDYVLGRKLEEAARALPGLKAGAQDAAAALSALKTEQSVLQALKDAGYASPANLARLSEITTEIEPALATATSSASAASGVSRFTGGLSGAKYVLGGTAIIGDVFTLIDPLDSGTMGWVDRGAAATNAALVGTDLAMTAGVFGAEATIPVAGEVLMAGTAVYLAGDYLYHNWGAFHDACDAVGNTTVSIVKDVGSVASDFGHGVANVAEDVCNAVF